MMGLLRRATDIPLDRDRAARTLPWIMAVMVFLASLALAGAMILSGVIQRWSTNLSGTLTVQVPAAQTAEETNQRLARVVAERETDPHRKALFAAMANRPEVRRLLAERGIAIPEGTWFLGAEHNTCDDLVCFYDLEDLPPPLREPLGRLRESLAAAGRAHARERCRRFASAPLDLTPAAALARASRSPCDSAANSAGACWASSPVHRKAIRAAASA